MSDKIKHLVVLDYFSKILDYIWKGQDHTKEKLNEHYDNLHSLNQVLQDRIHNVEKQQSLTKDELRNVTVELKNLRQTIYEKLEPKETE